MVTMVALATYRRPKMALKMGNLLKKLPSYRVVYQHAASRFRSSYPGLYLLYDLSLIHI